MNILFFLTPKSEVAYINEDDTLRQAPEDMLSSVFPYTLLFIAFSMMVILLRTKFPAVLPSVLLC